MPSSDSKAPFEKFGQWLIWLERHRLGFLCHVLIVLLFIGMIGATIEDEFCDDAWA